MAFCDHLQEVFPFGECGLEGVPESAYHLAFFLFCRKKGGRTAHLRPEGIITPSSSKTRERTKTPFLEALHIDTSCVAVALRSCD